MTTVTINRPGILTGRSTQLGGITFYEWLWYVSVDGQPGAYRDWVDNNDPAREPLMEQWVIDTIQADPGLVGDAPGDPYSDPNNGPGDFPDSSDYGGEYGGNNDSAIASDYGGDQASDYDGDFGGGDLGGDGALAGGGDGFGDSA